VPIDPQYPAERVAFMIADANAPRLLDAEWWDEHRNGRFQPKRQRLDVTTTQKNIAYMIYTSGSTGQTQGRDDPPRRDRQPYAMDAGDLSVSAADCVLQKTPFSF